MLELTGLGTILRGLSILYWLFALACLVAAFKLPNTGRAKGISVVIVVALFGYLPISDFIAFKARQSYSREAWAYFKNKCATEASEKIYKTFNGVKSVVVVKPLPPATADDVRDQYWYGDPYSDATPSDRRHLSSTSVLLRDKPVFGEFSKGFEYVEIVRDQAGKKTIEKLSPNPSQPRENVIEHVESVSSRFALSWEDISKPEDRKYWVAGSRLKIIDQMDGSTVAERIGYMIESGFGSGGRARMSWLAGRGPRTSCPSLRDGLYDDRPFVLRALRPDEGGLNGK